MVRIEGSMYGPEHILRLTWDDVMDLCRDMCVAIHKEFNPELVIGIAKGGVIPAVIIASMLKKDFLPISLSRRRRGRVVRSMPEFLVPVTEDVGRKNVLLVDETAATGDTFKLAMREVKRKGARKIKTAALHVSRAGYRPNWYGIETDAFIMKPWDYEVLENGKFVIRDEYLIQMDRLP